MASAGAWRDFTELLRNRDLVQICLADGVATACFSVFSTFIPVLVVSGLKLSAADAGWLLSSQGTAYIAALFLSGLVLARTGKKGLYLASCAMIIVALFSWGATQNVSLLWTSAIILGVGLGMIGAVNVIQLSKVEGERGKIAAFNGLFMSTLGVLSAMLAGWVGELSSLQVVFWLMIPPFVLLSLYVLAERENPLVRST